MKTNITISDDIHKELKSLCAASGTKISFVVEKLIEEFLAQCPDTSKIYDFLRYRQNVILEEKQKIEENSNGAD